MVSNEELIAKASELIKPKKVKDKLFADVGCALLASDGNIYLGVCGDVGSVCFCAETIAIGNMITNGEYSIRKIVATWKDEEGSVFVIPPCGNCRQMIKEIDQGNVDTEVILDKGKTVKLAELLPYHDWWQKQE